MNHALKNELGRAMRNRRYEAADDGRVLFPDQKLWVGGSFRTDVNGQDSRLLPNLFTTEGLLYVLGVAFTGTAAGAGFYLAPFSGNVAPDATLTGANFAGRQTEFTNYDEATRVAWTPTLAGTPQVDNSAALATFTNNLANATVWGYALLTDQVKGAITGKCIACFKDTDARTGLKVGDKLNVEYVISASDAG